METEVKLKYCLYSRKSTESDERQQLSIESQVKEMLAIAEKEHLDVIDIRRESHSAKASGERPVFQEVLEDIRLGKFNAILVWNPDRLSRNAGDLGSVVDLMDEKRLIEIRTYGQTFTNSPSEKFLLMILCSQAKLENDNKSVNVKRGLRTRCEMGLKPGVAPTGYLNENRADRKCQVRIDPERAPVIKQIFEKVAYEKWSGRKLYHWLRFELNYRTATGKKHLSLGNIYFILNNHFYYGRFEYPKQSGNWYDGKHTPIITRELFDAVQAQVKSNSIRHDGKEFAFTRIMKCGLCGSGISADEKFKKLKNGGFNRYVYYGCTKARDKNCKCGYINEVDLIAQLGKLIDSVRLNDLKIKKQIESDIIRYKKFHRSITGKEVLIELSSVDIKDYIKFLLKEGSPEEQREIMGSFKSDILVENKIIRLSP